MEDTKLIALDLSSTSLEAIELFIEGTEDHAIFEEILNSNLSRLEVIKLLYEHPNTPDDIRVRAAQALSLPVPTHNEIEKIKKRNVELKAKQPPTVRTERLLQRVQRLSVSEKIRLAQRGNAEVRGILLKDSNKQVVLTVLANPRITESEVEAVARNRSIVEDALREIAKNREWTKNYNIRLALVNNPKTPPGVAMNFVGSLRKKDLQMLEKNKNVSEVVRATAKKFLRMRQKQ
jgi:hypothetical protein